MNWWTSDAERITINTTDWKATVGTLRLGSDSGGGILTDATRKLGRIFVPHYTNAEEPAIAFVLDSDGTDNILNFGDGSAAGNKPTQIRFSTAANVTTIGGSVDNSDLKIDTSGNVLMPKDAALLQLGASQDYSIQWDATNAVHTVGSGEIQFTGGHVRIETADNGFSIAADADDFIIEGTGNTGMTISAGASSTANIYFGDSNNDVGRIFYNNSGNTLNWWTLNVERMTIDHLAWKAIVPSLQLGSDSTAGTLTNATRKLGRMFAPHYTNAEEPVNVFLCDSDGTDNIIGFGDGSANGNKASEIRFTTGANDTTQGSGATDTSQLKINNSQSTLIGAPGVGTNYLEVTTAADTFWVGDGTGIPYGHMYTNSTIAVTITDTTPVEIGDTWTTGQVNLVTFGASHYLTVTKAGLYKIDWSVSVAQNSPGAAIECEQGIMIDGVAQAEGRCHRTIANSSDTGASAGTAILDLAASKQISLYVMNGTNNTNIDIEHANVTVTMVGGT